MHLPFQRVDGSFPFGHHSKRKKYIYCIINGAGVRRRCKIIILYLNYCAILSVSIVITIKMTSNFSPKKKIIGQKCIRTTNPTL